MVNAREHRVGARQATGGELARLAVEKLGVVRLDQGAPEVDLGGGPAGGEGRLSIAGAGPVAAAAAGAAVGAQGRCAGGRPGVPLRPGLQVHV